MKHMFQDKVDACFSSYDPYTFLKTVENWMSPQTMQKKHIR